MKIHAPYNFVPLDKEVFFPNPKWANKISHDVPFSDGESGFISGKIKAETPIFISNGSAAEQDHEFSYYLDEQSNKKYFIPGTSLKGMLRNVVEIMSFAKMQFVDKWRPTYRDLSPSKTGKEYKKNMKNVRCGWLKETDNGLEIIDCGEPWRISHKQIDKLYELDRSFYDLFNKKGKNKINFRNEKKKTAKFKYQLIGNQSLNFKFKRKKKNNYIKAIPDNNGREGTIVFTGQPGPRDDKGKKGKRLEFVFIEEANAEILKVKKEVFKNFRLAYKDNDLHEISKDWQYWKKKLKNHKKIPVFFQKNNGKVAHFGLSYLYKLPYNYGIKESIPDKHFSKKPDLADCMFGYTAGKKALKGRVQCSHAECITPNPNSLKKQEVLSSPKPTFYPTYLKNGTYNDEHSKISGWKRYPIHQGVESPNYDDKKLKINLDNVGTKFQPLVAGTEFSFKIRYHNLRKVELGALLTALTFYGNEDKFYHSLGMAKPLGYGKISLKLNEIESTELALNEQKEYMDSFLSIVEEDLKINWKNSKQIKELLTMAHPQDNKANTMSDLSYLSLEHHTDIKKDKGKKLPYYSEIGNGVKPVSLQAKDDFLKVLQNNKLENIFEKYEKNKQFMEAVEDYLEIEAYDPDNFTYYQKFFHNPKIILKCLKEKDIKGRELKSILKSVKNYDYDLEDETTRKIFDYILAVKYNNKIPRRFSKVEKQFKYSWFNLNPDENNVLDIIAKAEKGKIDLWPPLAELKDYIISKKMKEKKVLLDMLEAILEK